MKPRTVYEKAVQDRLGEWLVPSLRKLLTVKSS
jgi:hypothetical protein